jgi:hypothetical protein
MAYDNNYELNELNPNFTGVINEIVDFIPLRNHEDYEILNIEPHTIKNRKTGKIKKYTLDKSNGYYIIGLNNKKYYKHRLLGEMFIRNNENLPEIDHVNQDRADSRICNLFWKSGSDNSKNRGSKNRIIYDFVEKLPDEAIVAKEYTTKNKHEFKDLYYANDKFYYFNGSKYKVLNINYSRHRCPFVVLSDINKNLVSILIKKFKKQHNIK